MNMLHKEDNIMEENAIKNKAIEMYDKKGAIDIVSLADTLGIKIYGTDKGNSYIKEKDNCFSIYVNTSHTKERQRFSIAHEMAHFIYHKNDIIRNDRIDREDVCSLSSFEENKADELAAELLMPKEIVAKYIKEHFMVEGNSCITEKIVLTFAKHFCVSTMSALVRLRKLSYYFPYI